MEAPSGCVLDWPAVEVAVAAAVAEGAAAVDDG